MLDIFASLGKLFGRLRHSLLVFRRLHPFREFVDFTEQILLLIAKSLQLSLNFLPLLLAVDLLQRGLQLRDLLIEVFLASGEVTETVQHLSCLALLLFLG